MRICNSAIACALLLPVLAVAATPKEQFDEQVAAYKKAGEPIEPQDFNTKPPPGRDNGALDLRAAWAVIDTRTDGWKKAIEREDQYILPLTDADADQIRAVVNELAFDLIDSAMTKKDVDWEIEIKSPTIAILLPDLSKQRALARLVAARALLAHHEGDDATALTDVRRMRFIANSVGRMPFVVSHAVSRNIDEMAARTAALISPELKVGAGSKQASAAALKQTFADLLDDSASNQSLRRALLTERMSQVDASTLLAEKKLDPKYFASVKRQDLEAITPDMAFGDALLLIRRATATIAAVSAAETWPAVQQKLPPRPAEMEPAQRKDHVVLNLLLPNMDNLIRGQFRTRTQRRMAATALAIRWYANDHTRTMPPTLNDLVPQYLPAVPVDATSNGQPISYIASGSAPALVSAADKTLITHLRRQPRKAAAGGRGS